MTKTEKKVLKVAEKYNNQNKTCAALEVVKIGSKYFKIESCNAAPEPNMRPLGDLGKL